MVLSRYTTFERLDRLHMVLSRYTTFERLDISAAFLLHWLSKINDRPAGVLSSWTYFSVTLRASY